MDIVVRKLERQSSLAAEEQLALKDTFSRIIHYRRDDDIIREGDAPPFVGALLEGMICRRRMGLGGARQIVALPLPGDVFDLHSHMLATMDHSVSAMTRCVVATAGPAAVGALVEAHPRLGSLLCRDALVETSILREWVVNCGRRNARSRIAHLLCELFTRLSFVGQTTGGSYVLPLGQADIADVAGLSVVHVNRVLQQLRAEGLVRLQQGRLSILHWERLAEVAEFDPGYLHDGERPHGSRTAPKPAQAVVSRSTSSSRLDETCRHGTPRGGLAID